MRICFLMEPPRSSTSVTYEVLNGLKASGADVEVVVACAAVAYTTTTRLAIGGVADRPAARDFGTLDGTALDDAINIFAGELEARDDLHATAGQRRDLVRKLGRIAIEEARACRA